MLYNLSVLYLSVSISTDFFNKTKCKFLTVMKFVLTLSYTLFSAHQR